jgi:hypothetical protein
MLDGVRSPVGKGREKGLAGAYIFKLCKVIGVEWVIDLPLESLTAAAMGQALN